MLRRTLFSSILVVSSTFASGRAPVATGVQSINFTVSDLDRSVDFYTKVLDFQKVSERESAGDEIEHLTGVFGSHIRTARLRLGSEYLDVTQFLAPQGLPAPADARSNDRWFQHIAIIVSDMDRAYARLREAKVRFASPNPQKLPEWNRNAAGIEAFYFRDPDGHPLEVLHFPEGKGAAKWHESNAGLFLGIDHTAIVVTDTAESLRFYRDLLGFHVAGESENYGPEQERLNNVFGAHLRITAVRGDSGPGVEFLEYLAPRDGRPYPAGEKANDLIHTDTTVVSPDAAEAAQLFRKFPATFISSGVIDLRSKNAGSRKALIIRDPDGHPVQIVEK
jgi:catechol 2,3-dioxygenase-like lactoylglutathione lyase family enzyme